MKKSFLNKIVIPARLLGLTHNVYRFSCIVEKDGKIFTESKQIVKAQAPYSSHSVSKSTVALALGLLYDKGLFTPQDKISDYLGEYFPKNVDKKWYDVTIDHLLHHRPGTETKEGFDAGASDFDEGEKTWSGAENLTAVFSCPIVSDPGTVSRYCDANYYVLARLAEKLCGMDLLCFLSQKLFAPMGFVNYAWTKDPNGHVMGGTGLLLRTEDFVKLGWLWLRKGVYGGVRYISEEWMTMGLTAIVDRTNDNHYGYGVRRLSEHGYSITGAYGQGLYFNDTKNFVVGWHARKRNQVMSVCEILDKMNIL